MHLPNNIADKIVQVMTPERSGESALFVFLSGGGAAQMTSHCHLWQENAGNNRKYFT